MFVTADGKNVGVTFILVSSLFLLWGVLQRDDRRDGQALPGRVAPEPLAVGLGAVRALDGLLPHGAPGGVAGHAARLQGRHHRRAAARCRRRVLVHPGHEHRGVLGVPARRVRRGLRPDVPGNGRQSLHHGARAAALCRDAHQPRAIVQRGRLGSRPGAWRALLLRQGHGGPQHGRPDALDSLRGRGGRGAPAGGRLLSSPRFRTWSPRTTVARTTARRARRMRRLRGRRTAGRSTGCLSATPSC